MEKEKERVRVKPFYLFLDVVQGAVDMNMLFDYMKSNYKKEIMFINGLDYLERDNGRQSKNENKTNPNTRHRHDASSSVVRGMKNKAEQETLKFADQLKKQRDAERKKNKGKGKSPNQTTLAPNIFHNEFDVLFIVQNFPYQSNQLRAAYKGKLLPSAFVSILPNSKKPVPNFSVQQKSSRTAATKRQQMPGSELDSSTSGGSYPPARWVALRPSAPSSIPFIEMKAGECIEETFQILCDTLAMIVKAKAECTEEYGHIQFTELPRATNNCDLSDFKNYLSYHPSDFVNALYYQLKQNNFKIKKIQAQPTTADIYNSIFDKTFAGVSRTCATQGQTEPPDPDFEIGEFSEYDSIKYYFDQHRCELEDLNIVEYVQDYINNPANFYLYAGTKFDMMVAAVNKKYSLGLPLSYFDWQYWNLTSVSHLTENISIIDGLRSASIIEKFYDKNSGTLFILTMEPVPRTIGQGHIEYYFPTTMFGVSEYITELYDKEEPEKKKSRIPPSPSSILLNGGDLKSLLENPKEKIKTKPIYKLPISCSECAHYVSPYSFNSGLHIKVNRDIIQGEATLCVQIYEREDFSVVCENDSLVFLPVEEVRFIINEEGMFSLIFYEQSIFYDGNTLIVKTSEDSTMAITNEGAFIISDKLSDKRMVVYPNGTIATSEDEKWAYVDKDGASFTIENGEKKPFDSPYSKVNDIDRNMIRVIRPDNIEYYITDDGIRRIVLAPELTIEQNKEEIIYEIPNMPVITFANKKGFEVKIDRFTVNISKEKCAMYCDDYRLDYINRSVVINCNQDQIHIVNGRYEVKSDDKILVIDKNGEEKMCMIPEEPITKKKIKLIQTNWGEAVPIKETLPEQEHVDLHKIFKPRFFAIKESGSLTEFIRGDTVNVDPPHVVYHSRIPHLSCEEVEVMSIHAENEIPSVYVENQGLNKYQRTNAMKEFHLPKKPKLSKEQRSQASTDHVESFTPMGYANDQCFNDKVFIDALTHLLTRNEERYIQSITPEEEEEPERLPLPPETPLPKLQKMMHCLHEPSVTYEANIINYWDLHISDFALPNEVTHNLPKLISPRVMLNDPPRFFDRKEEDKDFSCFETETPKIRTESRLKAMKVRSKIVSSRLAEQLQSKTKNINFGKVKAGEKATASICLKNTSKDPIHFTITNVSSNLIEVKTIPGTLFPGLSKDIVVELHPCEAQSFQASFSLSSKTGAMLVSVIAEIV